MSFLDLLSPKSCLECGKPGKYICESCLSKVKVLNKFDPKSETFSIFKYEGVIRRAIIKIKYNFAYDIASELAEISAQNLKLPYTIYDIQHTVLVPIPLHKSRQNWRGFNQSELLGKLIVEKLNWKFEKDILVRPIQGQNQVGLPKSERVRNIRGKYAVNSAGFRVILEAKPIEFPVFVVFDDVATTGSTLKEAIKVLKESGAKKVYGLTIAS